MEDLVASDGKKAYGMTGRSDRDLPSFFVAAVMPTHCELLLRLNPFQLFMQI